MLESRYFSLMTKKMNAGNRILLGRLLADITQLSLKGPPGLIQKAMRQPAPTQIQWIYPRIADAINNHKLLSFSSDLQH